MRESREPDGPREGTGAGEGEEGRTERMDLDEFTHITLAVASENGFASYAPTLIVGEQVQVIQGIPEGLDHREALQDVIRRTGLEGSDFLFGVRSGPGEITTGHHLGGATLFMRILELQQGFTLQPTPECAWWTLDRPGQ
ncbi:MAG: hypothetical protein HY823_13905 [Acidobacteria bacterium]|nr:hypothetical protein [Acidobacteriota bacterium]